MIISSFEYPGELQSQTTSHSWFPFNCEQRNGASGEEESRLSAWLGLAKIGEAFLRLFGVLNPR